MTLKLVAFRVFALVALAVCMAMLMDYLLPSPAFCGFKAGCEEVTRTVFGRPLGVPLPLWGLGAFGAFYGLTLFPAGRLGKLVGPAAILAGLSGLGFILLQVLVIRRLCPLCLIIDTAALMIAAIELGVSPARGGEGGSSSPAGENLGQSSSDSTGRALGQSPRRPRRWFWAGAAVVALAIAPVWTLVKPAPPVPEVVKSLWRAGKITVVEVTDFDCPHCRQTHPVLQGFLAELGDRGQFVRFVMPLATHANARPAARAHFAAGAQGKGAEMAVALFGAKDLTSAGCDQVAQSLPLDMEKYRADVADPATDAAIDTKVAWMDQHTIPGLPVIWVQDQRLVGAQTVDSLRAALGRAERRARSAIEPSLR